jgi:hypothetical protein
MQTFKVEESMILGVLELNYLRFPEKMWPGYTLVNFLARLKKIGGADSKIVYQQISAVTSSKKKQKVVVTSPILDSQGNFFGRIVSVLFCEKAFRDQLKSTTRFGNFWSGFRYGTAVFFFAMVIIFSGGANPNMNALSVLELFGAWSIMEIAFNRGILASFKFGSIGKDLGISLKLIILGIYSTVWLELVVLLVLLNTWKLFKESTLLTLFDYFQLFTCIVTLLMLSLPFSYLASIISTNKIDLRFVFPVLFKFLVFTTPLFASFHNNFPLIMEVVRYSPFSYSFSFVLGSNAGTLTQFLSFLVFIVIGFGLFFLIKEKVQRLMWIRINE